MEVGCWASRNTRTFKGKELGRAEPNPAVPFPILCKSIVSHAVDRRIHELEDGIAGLVGELEVWPELIKGEQVGRLEGEVLEIATAWFIP